MRYDERTAERVRKVLARTPEFVEKKMMGGICFMVDGAMCCGVIHSDVIVRVGRDNYERALAEPNVRPLEFGGRRPTGYVLVDSASRSDAALATWIERGIVFASSLPRKGAARKVARKSRARK